MNQHYLCPKCNKTMESGAIHCDRYAMRWVSDEDDKLFCGFFHGIKLNNFLEKSYVDAYICKECKKIIIDYESES